MTEEFYRLKSGPLERRLTLAKAGLLAGARYATKAAKGLFLNSEKRKALHASNLSEQAGYFVEELGKLKGSIVKVGQMMALWGEHFLPKEVTAALHTLEDHTQPMSWPVIRKTLEEELGETRLKTLDISPIPIGCASLGQVHVARIKENNTQICLKVQYPGVAKSIDSDLATMTHLLKLTQLAPPSKDLKVWLDALKDMLKQEVDYRKELEATRRFKQYLQDDPHYIVPDIFPDYSTDKVLATHYEPGSSLGSETVLSLSQSRRNHIARLCLELCWKEVFLWGEMQTDPNFGNYFVRLGTDETQDKLILLDFGAVDSFDPRVSEAGKTLITGVVNQDMATVKSALLQLNFLSPNTPEPVFKDFYDLSRLAMEPFLNEGEYEWAKSNLANRVVLQATHSALSRHFKVPPKEFMFISRKIIGAYTLMSILDAKIDGKAMLAKYIS